MNYPRPNNVFAVSDNRIARMGLADQASEEALIAGLRAGDSRAYEAMLTRYGPRMRATARRFFRCQHDADDAVQDALISVFQSIDRFSAASRLLTWLHQIVVNACLMKIRARSRRREMQIGEESRPMPGCCRQRSPGPDRLSDVEAHAATAEVRAHVRDCIERLPESYRSVLMLRDIDERDTTETALLLRESHANVKTRLHRARCALRAILTAPRAA
jgi:RNA polymerase sigma-70 factor (ECF subfamily)